MYMTRRQEAIASSFGRNVEKYDQFAAVQRQVASNLAKMLPEGMEKPDILEIGCGTGFLTSHLATRYPDASFLVTDICPEMVANCRHKFDHMNRVTFREMDGETPELNQKYDLIVSSLTVHWFSDPITNLKRLTKYLKPGGELYYATLGNHTFEEWRNTLKGLDFSSGFLPIPDMPGLFDEEFIQMNYKNALNFLKTLKDIGAAEPRAGYRPLMPVSLRKACNEYDQNYPDGGITWHIAYGRLEKF